MAAVDAFGTQWQVEFGATFVTVAELTNIDVLDLSSDTIDASSHDSPSQWREFINGMKDGGELSFECNFDPAEATQVDVAELVGGAAKDMKIVLPDAGAAEVTFSGLVTGFSAGAPFDDKLTGTATVKITGPVTVTP
jgi:predicted secreted protein